MPGAISACTVLIAEGYLKAHDRQARLAALIAETRQLPQIEELERRVNTDLLSALDDWLVTKPFARGRNRKRRVALLLTVFGGWLFFLSKRGGSSPPGVPGDALMLEEWADFWAATLDRNP